MASILSFTFTSPSFLPTRYDDDKKQWIGMIKEMRYAAGASCVPMRLNTARMPRL